MIDPGHDPLHERIRQAERRYGLLAGARRVLVGVSGGQDSVALLHSLVVMDDVAAEIGAIHVHHGMRGEQADADEAAVRALCEDLGVECFVARRNVLQESADSGLNLELAGRRARYEEYRRIACEHHFDRIATGHTGSDRAETLLLNLLRGAGLRGMRSIPPRRGRIIRPLICATRSETGDYCRRQGLPIRTDCTNLDPEHARRNALRLEIMPLIEELFPGVERSLLRACEAVEEELAWTEPIIARWLDEAVVTQSTDRLELDAGRLAKLHEGALHRVVIAALGRVRGDVDKVAREHIERVAKLIATGRTGGVVELPGDWRARREYECVVFERGGDFGLLPDEQQRLAVPGRATLPLRGVTVQARPAITPEKPATGDALTVYINAEIAREGLVLRSVRPGDRFVPFGMTGSKKLQDFFIDEKVPRQMRRRAAVVTDTQGRVLWVVGHRLAEPARAEPGREAVRLSAEVDDAAGL